MKKKTIKVRQNVNFLFKIRHRDTELMRGFLKDRQREKVRDKYRL